MIWIAAVILLAFPVIFLTRSIYRFIAPYNVGRDAYGHLSLIQDIRESGHRIPESPSKAATEGKYLYPLLVHWILSFFLRDTVEVIERYFSGIMDMILALLIVSVGFLDILTWKQVVIALIVFVATPEFMRPYLSHGVGMSGRKPGLFFTTICFLSLSIWMSIGGVFSTTGILSLTVSTVSGAFVVLTSKFSLQALFFISVGMVYVTPVSLAVFVGAIVLAIVLSQGFAVPLLKGHIVFLYDYAVSKQFKIPHTNSMRILPDMSSVESVTDLLEQVYKNDIIRPTVNNLFVVSVAVVYIASYYTGESVSTPAGFDVWIASGVGAFVLTSLPYLRFLGQAERYLEYIYLPSVVVLALAWDAYGEWYSIFLVGIVAAGLVTVPVYTWVYKNVFYDEGDEERFNEVIRSLGEKDPDVVLMQPIWKGRDVAYETPHKVVDLILNGGSTEESTEEINRLFPTKYGYLTGEVNWIEEKYDPEWIVFELSQLPEFPEESIRPPDTQPEYENEGYQMYRFDDVLEEY